MSTPFSARSVMRFRWLAAVVAIALTASPLAVPSTAAAAETGPRSCREELVTMRDRVRLHSWVNHTGSAEQPDRRPVLLELDNFTLPDNGCPQALPSAYDVPAQALDPEVSERFTMVHVNLRGTGSSEGTFDLWGPTTQADVAEVIAWARTQPWSNGKIILLGWSGTAVAIHYALEEPGVAAAVIYTTCADSFRCVKPGGIYATIIDVFFAIVKLSYASGLEARHRLGLAQNPTVPEQLLAIDRAHVAARTDPVYNDYWAERSSLARLANAKVPVLYTSDPYDVLYGHLDGYLATPGSRLVLGLGHSSSAAGSTVGSRHAELVRGVVDRFVRHHGLGERRPDHAPAGQGGGHRDFTSEGDAPVTLVTTIGSRAEWHAARALVRGETQWPLADTKWTRLYFNGTKSGSAGSLNDGSLEAQPDGDGTDVSPLLSAPNPYGDSRFLSTGPYRDLWGAAGPVFTDMSRDEATALTYTTPVLVRDLEVSGPITVKLVASSSASDFDWAVGLTDVWPDGRSEWITDGPLRASMRRVDEERSLRNKEGDIVRPFLTLDSPEPVPTNEAVEYLLGLVPMSNVFRAGHRLRIDIFPIARSNTDQSSLGPIGKLVVHRGAEGSSVLLPIIPARCQLGTAMHSSTPAVSCATSWKAAIGTGTTVTPPGTTGTTPTNNTAVLGAQFQKPAASVAGTGAAFPRPGGGYVVEALALAGMFLALGGAARRRSSKRVAAI